MSLHISSYFINITCSAALFVSLFGMIFASYVSKSGTIYAKIPLRKLFILLIFFQFGCSFVHQRPAYYRRRELNVLSPETLSGVVVEDILRGFDIVREAVVPANTDSAIAIGISEAIAGGAGALLSRGVANAVGDKKIDNVETKIVSTSSFFAVRSLARGVGRVLGLPTPVRLVLASLAGSLASGVAKEAGREINRMRVGDQMRKETAVNKSKRKKKFNPQSKKKVKENPESLSVLENMRNSISLREVSGDVTKWVVFDLLTEAVPETLQGTMKNLVYFSLGSVSAVSANFVKLLPTRKLSRNVDPNEDRTPLASYIQAAIEGGVLFLTYSFTLYAAMELIPSEINKDFMFNTLLLEGEESVQQTLLK